MLPPLITFTSNFPSSPRTSLLLGNLEMKQYVLMLLVAEPSSVLFLYFSLFCFFVTGGLPHCTLDNLHKYYTLTFICCERTARQISGVVCVCVCARALPAAASPSPFPCIWATSFKRRRRADSRCVLPQLHVAAHKTSGAGARYHRPAANFYGLPQLSRVLWGLSPHARQRERGWISRKAGFLLEGSVLMIRNGF